MRILPLVFLLISGVVYGQAARPGVTEEFASNRPSTGPTATTDYRIGSNDFLLVEVFGEPTLSSPGRVTASGTISLQLLGPVEAVGLTTLALEKRIEAALLDRRYLNDPHVTVTVQEFASQPVQVLGAVRSPNIYQLKGEKNLFGMIALAGGLTENVGRTIQVMRGALGINMADLEKNKVAGTPNENDTTTVDIEDFQRTRIGLDIPIYANDAIYVSNADSIFVVGEFVHPDEVVLRNGKDMSVIQAYGKAAGFTREAKKKAALIIRIHDDGRREEIPLDIDKMLKGDLPDIKMMANDILYAPSNRTKAAINRTLETAISVVTGRLIYR